MHNGNDVADGILGIRTLLEHSPTPWASIRLILTGIQQFDTMAAYAATTTTINSIDEFTAFAADLEKAGIVASRNDNPTAEMKIIITAIANRWIDAARAGLAA